MSADPVPENSVTGDNERQAVGRKLKCPHGVCDQACWWKPTMHNLNYQAKQYG